jgi:hypothetical protein
MLLLLIAGQRYAYERGTKPAPSLNGGMGAGTMAMASNGGNDSAGFSGTTWPLQDMPVGGAGNGMGYETQQAWWYDQQPAMVAPPRPPSPPKIPKFR